MNFEKILDEAHHAAQIAAAEEEAKNGHEWFPCGFAWVVTPANKPFGRHCRNAGQSGERETSRRYGSKAYTGGQQFWSPGDNPSQRMETHAAGARAFVAVLKRNGVEAHFSSKMD